ncbi:hypothetical protein ACHAPQ_008486 [Fusarium lateritium]
MLELRQGSKDLLQALELLRAAPEDSVAAMLQDLRSRGSVSEFLQSVNAGTVATSSPVNPLVTSLAGTLADSRVELDLNMRYTGAFPSLETLQITDVDLGLLAVHRRPGLTNQQTTMPLLPYSPFDLSSRTSGTPTTSESFSTPSDATGDAGQRVDPRLEFLRIWQWTSVPVPDLLAAQAISFYLINEHPVLAFFDADLMIRDFTSGGGRFYMWRPYLEGRSDELAAQDSDEFAAYEASLKQLKRLVYLYRTRFETTHQTMLITPGLLTLINEIFRKPNAPDAQFWFILAARGCLSIASWCTGLRGITEGLMTMGWRNGTFKRDGWADNSMVEDVRSTARTMLQDGTYNSLYPISFYSVSENIEDIGMEALAGEFQRLNALNEPRGKEVEVPSEQNVWKGDPRDLSLTLAEATEEEQYI